MDRSRPRPAAILDKSGSAEAKQAGIPFASHPELAAHPWTHSLNEKEVERLTRECARYEQSKRFTLPDRDFTVDGGELTYTMKLKRRIIEQRYHQEIETLYADVSELRPAAKS